jgi:rRNA maturation endonuclease Nob1
MPASCTCVEICAGRNSNERVAAAWHLCGVPSTRTWQSFGERLTQELAAIEDRFVALLDRTVIINVDPNRGQSDVWFAGAAEWGWLPDESLIPERTALLDLYGEWFDRYRLLHRSPLAEIAKRLSEADALMRRWLERERSDNSIPSTIDMAKQHLRDTLVELRTLLDLAIQGPGELLAVPDTNVLLREPDTAVYGSVVGTDSYTVVLLPAVLAELDALKDRGRTPEVRESAEHAVRRIKGLRDRGDLRTGVVVEGKVRLRAEHRETNPRDALGWLDPTVPDDRILGAALDLQSRAPASLVVLVTSDFNLQNKAAVAGLPFVEPPKP